MKVWVNGQIDFDIKNNMMTYTTQNIEDYLNSKAIRNALENRENFDIRIEEIFYVSKNMKHYLKKGSVIILEFECFEIEGESYFQNNTGKKYLDNYLCDNEKVSLGKTYFQLKYLNNNYNVGRYKHHLYEDLKNDQPPFVK